MRQGLTTTRTTSADMTTAADIGPAVTAGKHSVIHDLLISSDTQLVFHIQEATSGTILASFALAANTTHHYRPADPIPLPVAARKVQGKASASGNVYITLQTSEE